MAKCTNYLIYKDKMLFHNSYKKSPLKSTSYKTSVTVKNATVTQTLHEKLFKINRLGDFVTVVTVKTKLIKK